MSAARAIREELLVTEHPVWKQRVAYVLPVIPDAAPYAVREGIARRRIAVIAGQCPCGARPVYDLAAYRGEVAHERRCPAVTETLVKAIRRWAR